MSQEIKPDELIKAGSVEFQETTIGQTSKATATIQNLYEENITLSEPKTDDPDFYIVNYPKMLVPDQIGAIQFEFRPKVGRKTILRNANWRFKVSIG